MTQAFSDRLREQGAMRTWFSIVGDLSVSIPQQVLETTLVNPKVLGVITTFVAGALVAAYVIGIGPPLVLAGISVVAIGSLVLIARGQKQHSTEYLYGGGSPKPWIWWTALAALLATVYVVAATGQVISDPKPTNFGALGIMLGFAGLIVFGLRLRAQSRMLGHWLIMFASVPALMFFWIIWPAVLGLAIIAGAVIEIARATPQSQVAA